MEEQEISFQNTAYGYKTAVVANQRAFVANVRYPDTDGKIRNMGDRIQYTPTRKYDTFPQTYYLEVGGNDGDEIINGYKVPVSYLDYDIAIVSIDSPSGNGVYADNENIIITYFMPNCLTIICN